MSLYNIFRPKATSHFAAKCHATLALPLRWQSPSKRMMDTLISRSQRTLNRTSCPVMPSSQLSNNYS